MNRTLSRNLATWLNLFLVVTLLGSLLLPVQLAQAAPGNLGQPVQPPANGPAQPGTEPAGGPASPFVSDGVEPATFQLDFPASSPEPVSPALSNGPTTEAGVIDGDNGPSASPAASTPAGSPGLLFIENVGQFDAGARFMVRGAGGNLYLADDALWFTFLEQLPEDRLARPDRERGLPDQPNQPRRGVNLKLSFPGANPRPRLEPFDRLATKVSYFTGSDPAKWRPDVPVWGGVRYVDLYPGVDLEITGQAGQLVQRLVVRQTPASLAPKSGEGWGKGVRLRVEGADAVTTARNTIHLATTVGDITLPLFQAVGTDREPLNQPVSPPDVDGDDIVAPFAPASTASLSPGYTARAALGLAYPLPANLGSPLQEGISDLVYSTFLGGSNSDYGYSIAVDGSGNAYVTGQTYSSPFSTKPGSFYDTGFSGYTDAFVAKLSANGEDLIYWTYLGGSSNSLSAYLEQGTDIAVDESGHAYVVGQTPSSDFPIQGSLDTVFGGLSEAFVTKLNTSGDALIYSTYLGGSNVDAGYSIALDGSGNAYVAGTTGSGDFSTEPNFLDENLGGLLDAFVAKLDANGNDLIYWTFLGGSSSDEGKGIAVDGNSNVYVTGSTGSSNFPTTPDSFNEDPKGGSDAFVTKLSAGGDAFIYSAYLGGGSTDIGHSIAVDSSGNAYVTGETNSDDFLVTQDSFDTDYGTNGDAFVTKVNESGDTLSYSAYLGGGDIDVGHSIAVDGSGNAYVTGETRSSDFPTTPGAYNETFNFLSSGTIYLDAFVTKVNANGDGLIYSTFLGGTSEDGGRGIAVDQGGNTYLTGVTHSWRDFPITPGAYLSQRSWSDPPDAFVAKLALGGTSPLTLDVLDAQGSPVTQLITNTDGWPTPNPLTVTVTLECPVDGPSCGNNFHLLIDSNLPESSPDAARFYVYSKDLNSDGGVQVSCITSPDPLLSLHSYTVYSDNCFDDYIFHTLSLAPGETKTMSWEIWIQPSKVANLEFSAFWGTSFPNVGSTVSKTVEVPLAQIHPLVIVPGFAGTFPSEHGGKLDPLLRTYANLLPALQQAGYELGDLDAGATLIPFGYDWRLPTGYTGRITLATDIQTVHANAQTQPKAYVNYSTVDLVAHSGGGLVARAYIEDATANNEDYVNKLITLGAPHQGEVRAYPGWYGGDFSAFRLSDEFATVYLITVAVCADLVDGILGMPDYWTITHDNHLTYYYVRNRFQGAKDLLAIPDIEPPYLIRNEAPFDGFPYPQEYPEYEERPGNDFLEDLNNNVSDVQVGDYDVRKLEQIPKIITSFSDGLDTIEQYKVGPRPPAGTVPTYFWSHGEVITAVESPSGDGSVLAKSANLVEAISDADIDVSNIELAPEHTLPAISDDGEIVTIEPRHAALIGEANMVRRIISRTTGIDISLNQDFWDEPLPTLDLSSFWAIFACSPVRTMVIDPQGRRAGLDQNGQVINEIPGAVVTDDGTEPHLILLPEINEQFQIDTVGIDQGTYQIGVLGTDAASNQFVGVASWGVTTAGQKYSFAVEPSYFQESSGQVVMEAENFIWQIDRSNRSWFTQTTVADYVGAGYMSSGPDTDLQFQSLITTTSPELQYAIDFTMAGTYHVWLRGYTPNAAGDSVYVSIDNQQPIKLTGFPPREWRWSNQSNTAGMPVTFNIDQPGLHTLRIWQREDGLLLDRIVLSTNGRYNPSGDGPIESNRSSTLTP